MTVGPKRNALTWAMTVALSAGLSWAAVVPMEVEQLAVSADRIVIGDVLSAVSYRDKDTNLIMSRVVIDVSDDLKGRGDDRLTLELWGGSVDGVTLRTSVTPTFFEGDHVLLFLEGRDNRLVGEFQGAYLTDGNLAVQMHGGFQRFIPQSIHPLRLLIDKIRRALPRGQVPGRISPYDGDFTLDGEGGVAFELLGCDWTWVANPMGEVYRINANCVDSGCGTAQQQIDAINPGADAWNNAGADFSFSFAGTTTSTNFGGPANGQNIILFHNSSGLGGTTIAATFIYCSGNNLVEWDIVFNDFNFSFWNGVTGSCGGFRYDIQAVATHEFGHGLGLGHSPISGATMFASIGACDFGPSTLHADDIAGICFIYGCDPTGACCFDNGSCTVETSGDCNTFGGTYQGDGASCSPNPCPQPPTGACCFGNGLCSEETQADCISLGGTYQGDGTNCSPNPCPQPPTGACCLAGNFCEVVSSFSCTSLGGIYQGDGTTCTPNPCLPPTGACCIFPGPSCVDGISEVQCTGAGGVYQGNGTDCLATVCRECAFDADCDDGNPCNGLETCVGGICQPGIPLDCDDGNPCTIDSCDPVNGCVNTPQPDGTACDDGDPCTIADTCSGGVCAGLPIDCDDGNPCTIDSCDAGVCVNTPQPDGTACDDGDACTTGDTCSGGVCAGLPIDCDDGNPCTLDNCDPVLGCINTPIIPCCGNGVPEAGEDCSNCPADVQCPPGTMCVAGVCELLFSPADITGPFGVSDGCVDAFDLGAMLGAWCSGTNDPNPPSPPCENCTPANLAIADISGAANVPDGCVDAFDLAKLLAEWCSVAGGNPCGTCF